MKGFMIALTDGKNIMGYITEKTQTIKGTKYVNLTDEKIRAKWYQSKKSAENRADKLNNSHLYSGFFIVEEMGITVISK